MIKDHRVSQRQEQRWQLERKYINADTQFLPCMNTSSRPLTTCQHASRKCKSFRLPKIDPCMFDINTSGIIYIYIHTEREREIRRLDGKIVLQQKRRETSEQCLQSMKCPRYAFLSGPTSGLGHMISRVILGGFYALQKNATLVIDKGQFNSSGAHGAYPWAIEYFGFDSLTDIRELNISSLTVVDEPIWHKYIEESPICNILFRTCDSCCSVLNRSHIEQKFWCYGRNHWAFAAQRQYFMELKKTTTKSLNALPVLQASWNSGFVDVVWHVRIGDLELPYSNRKFYIDEVMRNIGNMFQGMKIQLFVVSEGNTSSFDFHPWFQAHGAQFLQNVSVIDALQLMIDSSVLVTSGSSFSAIATYFKPKETISFQSEPKEGTGIMDIFEHAFLNLKGNVTYPSFSARNQRAKIIISRIKRLRHT